MIAFAAALILTSSALPPVARRDVCLYNQLKTKATLTYFVPGEPVPKGGYPTKRVKPNAIGCIAVSGESVSVLARTSSGETVSCNWTLPDAKIQVNLSVEPNGLECRQPVMNSPAQ
jgi:hypothetical protein